MDKRNMISNITEWKGAPQYISEVLGGSSFRGGEDSIAP